MDKRVALNQPYIFPYLGYFQLLYCSDVFIIYDDVNYIKQGWIHRNQIDQALLFSVPLSKPSQNRLIKDTLIHESYLHWKAKFEKTLRTTYSKAAQFKSGLELVVKVLDSCEPGDSIAKLATNSIKEVARLLNFNTTIIESSTIYRNTHLAGQDRILDICRQEKATQYINAIGGKELYDSISFSSAGIELKFLKKGNKSNNLSVIDALMRFSPCETKALLEDYTLEAP